jgi:hypothetical protein
MGLWDSDFQRPFPDFAGEFVIAGSALEVGRMTTHGRLDAQKRSRAGRPETSCKPASAKPIFPLLVEGR